jgi:PadR family transcriptional regulator PadR
VAQPRRLSAQTIAVVRALAEDPTRWRYGYELCRTLEIHAGSMYPILIRLADRGLLETAWESDAPAGRPPRHLYRLTGPGLALATELAAQLAEQASTPAAGPERLQVRWEGA